MNEGVEGKPASHVAVDLSESRVDGLWSRVSTRLESTRPGARGWRAPRRRWVLAGGLLCAAGAAAVAIVVGTGQPGRGRGLESSAWEGASLETDADAVAVRLVDGSELALGPASRVDVGERTPSAVKLVLKRGRLACDVIHRPERSFVVMADGVEVRVIGTRFSVATEHGGGSARVEVRVERGVVEVRGPGAPVARVEAGRSWSQVISANPLGRARAAAIDPPTRDPAQDPTPRPRPRSPLASGADDAGETESQDLRRPRLAAEASGPHPVSAPSPSPAAPAHVSGPRELFKHARDQWRQGRIEDAADTYQRLLSEYPRDGRAGLAAFELGRLRMDRLGDLRGAARALERAVALAPGSEFREDAMARLVAANAGAHDVPACIRARDQYLVEFPRGFHRRIVAAACD